MEAESEGTGFSPSSSLIGCVALGKSLYLSDPSFLFCGVRNKHLALRDVCSEKYIWVELFFFFLIRKLIRWPGDLAWCWQGDFGSCCQVPTLPLLHVSPVSAGGISQRFP